MVPLEQVVRVKETTAPQVISHFNLFRSATINGSAPRRLQLRPGAAEMERDRRETLPAGHELRVVGHFTGGDQGGSAVVRGFSGSALLLVYLTLAAQYRA